MIGTCRSSGSGTSSMSGFGPGRSATTRCALYDGIRSTRHCGRQSLSHAQTRWVGRYSPTSRLMKSMKPRTAFTGVPSGASTSGTPKKARKYIDAESRTISRCSVATRPESAPSRRHQDARVDGVEETDRTIVRLLAADGRMSFTDLGKATGLSTSAVHQRVKRLEKRGVITGYGAGVDHEELGLALTAFVSITPIDPSQPDDYPERLRDIEEIESCWSVAGDESYILKVRVATPSALERLIARIRSVANVSTRTTIVLSTPYENRPVT